MGHLLLVYGELSFTLIFLCEFVSLLPVGVFHQSIGMNRIIHICRREMSGGCPQDPVERTPAWSRNCQRIKRPEGVRLPRRAPVRVDGLSGLEW